MKLINKLLTIFIYIMIVSGSFLNFISNVNAASIKCPDGYRSDTYDDQTYCINQFEDVFGTPVNVQLRKNNNNSLYCLALSVPMKNANSHQELCGMLGDGWSTYLDCEDNLCMCQSVDVSSCTGTSYYINYDYGYGGCVGNCPSSAKTFEEVQISTPVRFLGISGVDRKYGAVVGDDTKIELIFDGWTFDGSVESAKYGVNSGEVNQSWNNHNTKVKAGYFKDLTANGLTVKLTAHWKLEDTRVELPTLKKEGYDCLWYTHPDPRDGDVGYTPGSIVELPFIDLVPSNMKVYANCTKTFEDVGKLLTIKANSADGYIKSIDGIEIDYQLKVFEQECNVLSGQKQCSVTENVVALLEGHKFLGWTLTKGDCASPQKITEFLFEEDTTVYACYQKDIANDSSSDVLDDDFENDSNNNGSSDGGDSNNNGVDDLDNPSTGDIPIFVILLLCVCALGYSIYYFNKVRENKNF